MSEYGAMMYILPRMETRFTREELELAAKVFFYLSPPRECDILPEAELDLRWSEDFFHDCKVIRVSGDVICPDNI